MSEPLPLITAKVVVHRNKSGRLFYEWEGPEDGVIAISVDMLKGDPTIPRRLPWKVIEIGRSERTAYFRRREYAHGTQP